MKEKNIVIYTTPSCGFCKMAKSYFKENGVAYTEHDVVTDLSAREEMLKLSGQSGVPVITVDGEMVIGFDQGRLATLLAN